MDATRSAFNAPPPIGLLSLSLPFPLSLLFLLTPHLFLSHLPSALQKSFILPRGVTGLLLLSLCSRLFSLTLPSVAMHHTVTERGITNKNLLIGLSTGQLLSLDTRAIDPRRPLGAPSQLEKEEVPHLSSLLLCSALLSLLPLVLLSQHSSYPLFSLLCSRVRV
jgi:branched-subunit amino acid transport protein